METLEQLLIKHIGRNNAHNPSAYGDQYGTFTLQAFDYLYTIVIDKTDWTIIELSIEGGIE